MPLDKLLEALYRYGSPTVYSAVFMIVLYKFGIRVLNSYEKRESVYSTTITTGMASITHALQELSAAHQLHLQMYERISKDMKDGFDRMHDMGKYQRDEHKELLEKIADSEKVAENAREKIISAIGDTECRAK